MRLTAIKLAGFKSFVDPTTLTLDAHLTGIVGPNGCGKSNVIDAVRWVTGESSAKQLRGAALEDVIFNGSAGRKPVGRVTVELKFDNSDGQLGGQYARFTEIAIRRELSRDGGSRFFINGTKARRRDVVDLFLGTGLGGRNNYAVIQQGAVNRLVEAKPDELRRVLEETAGISRYKERRRETENRIRHTRENLDRLNDLIGEVTQRLGVLKRQARNAERYKTLKQDERRLRAELLALRWQAFDADVQTAQQQLTQQEQALATAVSTQRRAQAVRDEQEQTRQAAAAACQQQQTAFYDAQAEATRIAQALAHARQLQQMQEREQAELTARQAQLQARAEEDEAALAQVATTLQHTTAALTQQQAEQAQAQIALQQADAAVDAAEQRWQSFNDGQASPLAQLQAARSQRDYVDKRRQQEQASHDKRQREADDIQQQAGTVNVAALTEQVAALTQQLQRDEQHSRDLGKQSARADANREQLRTHIDALRTRHAEQQARLSAAKAMQQAALREDDADLHGWLQQHDYADARSLARQVTVPAAWQVAVEAALAPWLAGFAVSALPEQGPQQEPDWPQDTLTLVEVAATQAGRATQGPQGLPSLASRMQAPTAVLGAASRIFVAATVTEALQVRDQLTPEQMLVTLDGACVGASWLRTPLAADNRHGILEREREIKTLSDECDGCDDQLATLNGEYTTLEQQRSALREQATAAEQALMAKRHELSRQQAELQGEQARQQQRRQRAQELATELARLQQQLQTDADECAVLEARIAELQTRATSHERERDATRQALTAARQARQDARGQYEQHSAGLRQLQQERASAQTRHDSLTARLEDTRTTRAQVDQRWAEVVASAAEEPDAVDATGHDAAQARRETAETALRDARTALQQAEQQGAAAARAVLQADNAVTAARETMQQGRIAVETAAARRDGLNEQLDELGADARQLLATLSAQATVAAWHDEIEAVERRIARLGAINLAAIDEHAAEAEREQYLSAQHNDLSAALATLETAIAKIDRETRSRFKATFTQANERFATTFPTLFGGGQAALELTEDDLLATGVRVMARPPGKRNASIQMLSGGEKTMTAMALLFALFELNPAPFCMLDEIDAPLDDANVARFCDLVRAMSARVQFVVITHNKLTMELAEQLHGVTMLEPGVSRLVSVNIEQALDMAG